MKPTREQITRLAEHYCKLQQSQVKFLKTKPKFFGETDENWGREYAGKHYELVDLEQEILEKAVEYFK